MQVAQYLKAGMSQRDIAEAVERSLGTVNNDIKILRGRWQREQTESVDEAMTLDLLRLNDLLTILTNPVREGDLPTIDRYLKVLERRARILGYDAPAKIAGPKGGPIEVTSTGPDIETLMATAEPEVREKLLEYIQKRRELRQRLAEMGEGAGSPDTGERGSDPSQVGAG